MIPAGPVVACLLVLSWAAAPVWTQDSQPTPAEQRIMDRETSGNGIYVGEPKVYDDSVLVQMLQAASAKLAGMSALDIAGVNKQLGAVTGVNQTVDSFGVNVGGPATPSVATAKKDTDVSTTTTQPSFTVPTAPTPPTPVSTPTSFGVSASDILSEQMQLTYEIANLRLLLEGSLNDRLVPLPDGTKTAIVKPRATLGFPITLEPGKYKDAVAVVEVEVESNQEASYYKAAPPAVAALLPREKTYNVASITDKSVSVGGGAVTQIMGGSFSFLHGHKTYFLVKDQDTLALQFAPTQTNRAGFLWQFRPVLGRRYPLGGLKQTFVQLTFPIPYSAPDFGTVYVRTYWREYDRKNGIVKDVIPGSLQETTAKTIPYLTTRQSSVKLNIASVEDIGGGQVLVDLHGSYLNGTSIRIGSTLMSGLPGLVLLPDRLMFTASAYDLATKKTTLMSRGGIETDLVLDECNKCNLRTGSNVASGYPTLTTIDDTNTLLTVRFTGELPRLHGGTPYVVFLIGNKVFGLSDAPITWSPPGNSIIEASVLVPTSLLLANKQFEIKSLLAKTETELTVPLPGISMASKAETLVLIGQDEQYANFLLYGNRLDGLAVLAPSSGVDISQVGNPADSYTLRLLRIKTNLFKSYKQLVLQRPGDRPFTLALPTLDAKAADAKPAPKDGSTLTVQVPAFDVKVQGIKPAANGGTPAAEPACKIEADGTHTPLGCTPKAPAVPATNPPKQ